MGKSEKIERDLFISHADSELGPRRSELNGWAMQKGNDFGRPDYPRVDPHESLTYWPVFGRIFGRASKSAREYYHSRFAGRNTPTLTGRRTERTLFGVSVRQESRRR